MGIKFNPFTGNFDLAGSKVNTYLDGEVATFADLPLDTAAAPLNSAWLVREASGLWLVNRKPAGIYIRTATGGTDRNADYTYASAFPDVFSDANFTLYDDADSTKNAKFSLGGITTGTTRTLTVPDASGTLPLLESANTFTQNQTLNGTNNVMPNQTTAASGSSIMTRDLVDARYFPYSPAAHAFGSLLGANAALGPFMMVTRQDTNYNFNWAADNSAGFGLPFFCNNGKSINTVRIQHTAGTHPTAQLEVGIYLANSSGLPDTYVEKVAFPLDTTGNKTQTLTSPFTPSGLFWVLFRPTLGDTNFKAGGNGVTLQTRGHGNGYNLWAASFFGAQLSADITQFGASLMPRRALNANVLPTSSVVGQLELVQTANGPHPTCVLY
jgi:hypothetical protein